MNAVGSVRRPQDCSPEQGTRQPPSYVPSHPVARLVLAPGRRPLDRGLRRRSRLLRPVEVGSVTVSPATSPLGSIGQTVQLSAVVADADGADRSPTRR